MKILLFGSHKGDLLSFAIKALTRSAYCHAAILVDTPKWRVLVARQFNIQGAGHLIIEAYYPKVRARLLRNDELASIDVYDVPVHTPDKEDISMAWLIDQVKKGEKYDVVDLFRFLAPVRAVIGEANSSSYKRHTFCSMLDLNGFRVGGTRLLSSRVHDFLVSPDKLSWSPLAFIGPKLEPIP